MSENNHVLIYGRQMSSEIPIPISNYLYLIQGKKPPYYDVVLFIVSEMEKHLSETQNLKEVVYTVNPKRLRREIEKKVKHEKLTTLNISRTILAFLYGNNLKRDSDYYITTTSGGCKNYHIRVNTHLLSTFKARI